MLYPTWKPFIPTLNIILPIYVNVPTIPQVATVTPQVFKDIKLLHNEMA
jgi:hypothetical protein